MFCPKCGTKNPANGKFCRSCGTDLSPVSDALAGKSSNQWQNFSAMKPIKPLEPMDLWNHKGKPVHWEGAFGKLFMGIAFMVVSIVIAVSGRGTGWWFWMLIPAFSMLGAGIAQIMQLRKNEKGMISGMPPETQFDSGVDQKLNLPPSQTDYIRIEELINSGKNIEAIKVYRETFGVGLKEAKEAVDKIAAGKAPESYQTEFQEPYVKPQNSIYETGDLRPPPSVTEGTTRHLEINPEGETMSLPKTEK